MPEEEKKEVLEEETLNIPDLISGVIVGIREDNGGFYLQHITKPLDPPFMNLLVIQGLLQMGLEFIHTMTNEMTKIGLPHRLTQLLGLDKSIVQGISGVAGEVATLNKSFTKFLNLAKQEESNPTDESK